MYATTFIMLKRGRGKISAFTSQDYKVLLVWPLYFLAHTVAAYKALYELVIESFAWNKTKHGVSRKSDKGCVT